MPSFETITTEHVMQHIKPISRKHRYNAKSFQTVKQESFLLVCVTIIRWAIARPAIWSKLHGHAPMCPIRKSACLSVCLFVCFPSQSLSVSILFAKLFAFRRQPIKGSVQALHNSFFIDFEFDAMKPNLRLRHKTSFGLFVAVTIECEGIIVVVIQ